MKVWAKCSHLSVSITSFKYFILYFWSFRKHKICNMLQGGQVQAEEPIVEAICEPLGTATSGQIMGPHRLARCVFVFIALRTIQTVHWQVQDKRVILFVSI